MTVPFYKGLSCYPQVGQGPWGVPTSPGHCLWLQAHSKTHQEPRTWDRGEGMSPAWHLPVAMTQTVIDDLGQESPCGCSKESKATR